MRADLEALAQIGATPGGGVDRSRFNDAHLAARAWFLERARRGGLRTAVDAAGNHSARLGGGARTLLLGSHLDSVPAGGRFDGALGVVAALHALLAVAGAGGVPPLALEAIDFTDEEGTLVGLLGSEALAGTLAPEALRAPRGGREALLAGLERAGLREEELSAARARAGLARRLPGAAHRAGAGARARRRADRRRHGDRRRALVLADLHRRAPATPARRRWASGATPASPRRRSRSPPTSWSARDFPGAVATVGRLALEPGAYNVIPGRAVLALEFRAADARTLDELERALLDRAARAGRAPRRRARRGGRRRLAADAARRRRLRRRRARRGALALRSLRMPSGAGHDAQALAGVTAAGMVFVPSVGGISHDPRELTTSEDCRNGANVLLGAALELAGMV